MFKIIIAAALFVTNIFAIENLAPDYSLKASGSVQDISYKNGLLYAATDMSILDIFDVKTKEIVDKIEIPYIKDFAGDEIPSKLYSVDIMNDSILIVSQGMKGFRNLWLYKDKKLTKLIDIKKHLFMKEARFVDDSKIIIGLLSNEIIHYDINKNKIIYQIQVSPSSFSDLVLSEDKKEFATTDESGIVRIMESNSGKITKVYKGQNLDRVYQLDLKKNIVLTAGQDRRAVIYSKYDTYYMPFNFLLYSCGLSPDAKLAAIAYNEKNEVLVFNVQSKSKLYNLSGQDATLTKILFIDNNSLFTSSDSKTINFWKLKK